MYNVTKFYTWTQFNTGKFGGFCSCMSNYMDTKHHILLCVDHAYMNFFVTYKTYFQELKPTHFFA